VKNWNPIGDAAREVVNKLIDARARRAISNLVRYVEAEEKRHYEECPEDMQRTHIYQNVLVVQEWLNTIRERTS
jgi:hypothetical protein